jgi:hypothetical protein
MSENHARKAKLAADGKEKIERDEREYLNHSNILVAKIQAKQYPVDRPERRIYLVHMEFKKKKA